MDSVLGDLRGALAEALHAADWGLDSPSGIVAVGPQLVLVADPRGRTATILAAPLRLPSDRLRTAVLATDADVKPLSIALNKDSTMVLIVGADSVWVAPVEAENVRRAAISLDGTRFAVRACEVGADASREARFGDRCAESRAVVAAQWHPSHESAVGVLTSDGVVRLYDVAANADASVAELRAGEGLHLAAFAFGSPCGLGWSPFTVWGAIEGTGALCCFAPVVIPGMKVEPGVLNGLRDLGRSAPRNAAHEVQAILEEIADWPIEEDELVALRCPERMRAPSVRVYQGEVEGDSGAGARVTAIACLHTAAVPSLVLRAYSNGTASIDAMFDPLPAFLTAATPERMEALDLRLSAQARKDALMSIFCDPHDKHTVFFCHKEGVHEARIEWLRELESSSGSRTLTSSTVAQIFRVSPNPEHAVGIGSFWDAAAGLTRVLVVSSSGSSQLISRGEETLGDIIDYSVLAGTPATTAAPTNMPAVPQRELVKFPEDQQKQLAALQDYVESMHTKYKLFCSEAVAVAIARWQRMESNTEGVKKAYEEVSGSLREAAHTSERIQITINRLMKNNAIAQQRIQTLFEIWGELKPELSHAEIKFEDELREKLHASKRLCVRVEELSRQAEKCAEKLEAPGNLQVPKKDLRDIKIAVEEEHREISLLQNMTKTVQDEVKTLESQIL